MEDKGYSTERAKGSGQPYVGPRPLISEPIDRGERTQQGCRNQYGTDGNAVGGRECAKRRRAEYQVNMGKCRHN